MNPLHAWQRANAKASVHPSASPEPFTNAGSDRSGGGSLPSSGLNGEWEIDHTDLDVLVANNATGNALARPRWTVILDCGSRAVMGFNLALPGTPSHPAADCLRQATLPKHALFGAHSDVRGEWPCHGVPKLLTCDNDMDFHAPAFRQACLELGIDLRYRSPKQSSNKARVERFFWMLSRACAGGLLAGRHPTQPLRLMGVDERAVATITRVDLEATLARWIVDVYMVRDSKAST